MPLTLPQRGKATKQTQRTKFLDAKSNIISLGPMLRAIELPVVKLFAVFVIHQTLGIRKHFRTLVKNGNEELKSYSKLIQ